MTFERIAATKRRLRALKRQERLMRGLAPGDEALLWYDAFDLTPHRTGRGRYSLADVLAMDEATYRDAVDAYFFRVCFAAQRASGACGRLFDPDLLARMGLPPDADEDAVKAKFRELAKKTHPDLGGEASRFVELREIYKRLTDETMI